MNMQDLHDTIKAINDQKVTEGELLNLLGEPVGIVRANAILGLASRKLEDPEKAVNALEEAALKQHNKRPLYGTISVAKLAIAALSCIGTSEANLSCGNLLTQMSEQEREDLRWFIRHDPLR